MWPFKHVCERKGHSWNVLGGFHDGHGGTVMRPLDGSGCLKCPAIYRAAQRTEKMTDPLGSKDRTEEEDEAALQRFVARAWKHLMNGGAG